MPWPDVSGGTATSSTGETGPAGPTGPTGPAGADGLPGLVWRSTWSGATAYAINDAVQYNGSAYVALQTGTNQNPATQTAYWSLLAQKGDTGATGATGATGPQGPPGSGGGGSVDQYLWLPGTAGHFASIPNSGALQIRGNIDIRVRVNLDDWQPAVNTVPLVTKRDASTSAYGFWIAAGGALHFNLTTTGANFQIANSNAPPFVDGTTYWLRVTRNSTNGLVSFYWASDLATMPTTWTALGTTTLATGLMYSNTVDVELGGFLAGTYAPGRLVKLYYVQIASSITGGGEQAVVDFVTMPIGATQFYESSGNRADVYIHSPVNANGARDGTKFLRDDMAWSSVVVSGGADTTFAVLASEHGVSPNNSAAANDAAFAATYAASQPGSYNQRRIHIGAGQYYISQPLNWANGSQYFIGQGFSRTEIIQTGGNMPVLQVAGGSNHIEGMLLGYPFLQGAAATETKCLECTSSVAYSVFRELKLKNGYHGFWCGGQFWSNLTEHLIINDYRGWGIYIADGGGHTGSVFNNVYIQCNSGDLNDWSHSFPSPPDASWSEVNGCVDLTAGGVYIFGGLEMVFNQLNIEWGRYVYPLLLQNSKNIIINGLHFEGCRLVNTAANGASLNTGSQFPSLVTLTQNSRAIINGFATIKLGILPPNGNYNPGRAGILDGGGPGTLNGYSLIGFPATTSTGSAIPSGSDSSECEIHGYEEEVPPSILPASEWPGSARPARRIVKGATGWNAGSGVRFSCSKFGGNMDANPQILTPHSANNGQAVYT